MSETVVEMDIWQLIPAAVQAIEDNLLVQVNFDGKWREAIVDDLKRIGLLHARGIWTEEKARASIIIRWDVNRTRVRLAERRIVSMDQNELEDKLEDVRLRLDIIGHGDAEGGKRILREYRGRLEMELTKRRHGIPL